jgi:type I restriction enzyme S subunit
VKLADVAEVRTGVAKGSKRPRNPVELPYLRVANVQAGALDLSAVLTIEVEGKDVPRYSLRTGDVLMTEGGDFDKLGRGTIWAGEIGPCLHQNHVFSVRCDQERLLPDWLSWVSGSHYGRRYFLLCSKQSTNLASINSSQLKAFPLPLPSIAQQKRIATIIKAADAQSDAMSRLIEAKRTFKRGLMQQLLTGQKRFPEFVRSEERHPGQFGTVPKDWSVVHLAEIAHEVKARGETDGAVVYSVTKHDGLVPSLEYFGKQVFSRNLDGYKRLQPGDFAYATNHIEEGSIGLLREGQPPGLVSPMYTVFRPTERVDPEFLFVLLKTESYRRVFETRMSASVDRRGSLRWKEFARIKVGLPPLDEQRRIAATLRLADREIALLAALRDQIALQKRAVLSKLLSGEIPVPA